MFSIRARPVTALITLCKPVTMADNWSNRGVLTSGFAFGVATDFAVLGGLAAILLAISAYLFSKIEV